MSAEEDVVVGAAKREQSLGNVASAVTVITADRIKRFGYRTVGEAVASVAGAYFEDTRIVATIGFRGINILGDFNTRILVLVDGASVNEGWGSFAGVGYGDLVAIDDIARIEVIRGPVSSVYGTNAFFGIINIVTRGATETPHAWGRIGVNSINGAIASRRLRAGQRAPAGPRHRASDVDGFGETLSVPDVGDNLAGDDSNLRRGLARRLVQRHVRAGPRVSVSPRLAVRAVQRRPRGGRTRTTSTTRSCSSRAVTPTSSRSSSRSRVARYCNMYEFFDHIVQYQLDPFEDYGDAKTVGAELRGRYEAIPATARHHGRHRGQLQPHQEPVVHRSAATTQVERAEGLQHRGRLHRARRQPHAVARLHRAALATIATRRSTTGCRRAPRCSSRSPRSTA